MGRCRRRVGAAMISGILVVVASCGDAHQNSTLRGLVRETPLVVGDLTVSDISTGGTPVPLTLRAESGELLVMLFGYTGCPDVCPTTLADLRAARRRLPEARATRVVPVMMTVDPNRDRPEVLVGYLSSFAERFHALRPNDPGELARVQDAFLATSNVSVDPSGRVMVAHSTTVYVIDDSGAVVVEWPFAISVDHMVHDLSILLDRADRRTERGDTRS